MLQMRCLSSPLVDEVQRKQGKKLSPAVGAQLEMSRTRFLPWVVLYEK